MSISRCVYYDLATALKFKKKEFFIYFNKRLFPIFLDYKGLDKWLILLPGRTQRNGAMPVFQRSYYSPFLRANVISLFDPSLFCSKELTLAWFFGDEQKHYAALLGEFLALSFKQLKIDTSNIYLYGSSGGGIPAIVIASFLSQCKVCTFNIQTDISKYYQRFYNALIQDTLGLNPSENLYQAYKNRLNCYGIDGNFTLYCIQNISDTFHYQQHFLPYKIYLEQNKTLCKFHFYTFANKILEHSPFEKDDEIEMLNNFVQNSNFDYYLVKKLEKISKDKRLSAVWRVKNTLDYQVGFVMIQDLKNLIKILFLYSKLKSMMKNYYQEEIDLKLEDCDDYQEALKLKEHLSYKLGSAFLARLKASKNVNSFIGMGGGGLSNSFSKICLG